MPTPAPITLIGWIHTIACFGALATGFYLLASLKGSLRHRAVGRWYVYSQVAACLTALTIYATGHFRIFHGMAIVTLAFVLLGVFAARRQARRGWALTHVTCMVVSYYMLVGGAVNEAFLRIPLLQPYFGHGRAVTQTVVTGLFIGILGYLLGRAASLHGRTRRPALAQ